MDPVTVGVAAAALLASKFGEGFAKDAGESAWNAVKKLRELVVRKLSGEADGKHVMALLAAEPSDARHQTIVARRITEAAVADDGFGAEIAALVAEARKDPAVNSVIAHAADNAKQVNIGGNNFGAISL